MNKYWKALLILCLFVTTVTSCVIEKTSLKALDEQFIFVKQDYVINICSLFTSKCNNSSAKTSGSGVLIAHDRKKGKSYTLTAAHVCRAGPTEESVPPFIKLDVQENNLVVFDSNAKEHKGSVFAIDEETDLCLIEFEKIDKSPIVLAKKPPKRRAKVVNVAAPFSLWKDGLGVIYEGIYFGDKDGNSVYLITAMPGSSGSPLVNKKDGKLVGVISRASENAEMVLSPTYKELRTFLESNLDAF